MESYQFTIAAISLLCLLLGVNALASRATTTYRRSTIVGIDETRRTLTILTQEGRSWTLPIWDPTILTTKQLSTEDQVSIELDRNDRISKIIKLAG